ncbi:DUF368 domain-containing protein [Selenihalanaerobacter shriftii]|uniref:Putative membrane protein n=1 Tax=Selenihalanaerobacter shriftii TaxID=142842 RepID=A0A1T4JPX9_9FIRM|nr:DUF368 domain-containing protein [Selenihalanaerobacter shriftii]SJZ32161.1 putative membrane protein [Selenihalanaerobacter shriftii]
MSRFWELVIKGIPIGISNTLPGISGGTMALILGIYDQLVNGIKKINLTVLIPILFGAIIGVIGGSKVIVNLLELQPGFTVAFLLGLILTSSKVTAKEIEDLNLKTIILFILGLIIAYHYSIDIDSVVSRADISLFKFFWGGAIGSVAMILPGVSGGTLLIMLGLYQNVLQAIINFDILVLFSFGGGVGVGLLGFSWLLSYLLAKWRSFLMAFLTGLILGSIRTVIPNQLGVMEFVGFILGFLSIWFLDKREV